MNGSREKFILIAGMLLALFAGNTELKAYSEDICVDPANPNNLIVANCWDIGCADYPDVTACPIKGIMTYGQTIQDPITPNRSVLHFDLVWIIARMNGISAERSLELASYSQASDKGVYSHISGDGNRSVLYEVEYAIDGVARNGLLQGGPWFHFPPRSYGSKATTAYPEGYLPYSQNSSNPFPAEEQALSHVRKWAFGERKNICLFGMTSLDGNCLIDNTLKVEYAGVAMIYLPVTYSLGQQTLSAEFLSETGQQWDVATMGTLKSLGVYLHLLGDRLSHYKCNEVSTINKYNGAVRDYLLEYDTGECGQIEHAWRHYEETGHGYPPARTTSAIEYFWKEIQSFLQKYPKYKTDSTNSLSWSQAQTSLAKAIGTKPANERLGALCSLSRSWGLGWHDGNKDCKYQTLPYNTLPVN